MPIIPELKNIGLKKYFQGIVNYVDSVETFHKLTDDVETTPSKNLESKTIPEVVAEPETEPEAEPEAEPLPEAKPAAAESQDNDSLDSEKSGEVPAKGIKKPAQDELPNAPKLGRTEGDDDLLEDPAP